MTEDEAKTKWCPMVRTMDGKCEEPVTINRDYDGEIFDHMKCIASGCMAWRWDEAIDADGGGTNYDTEGRCGLAGKP